MPLALDVDLPFVQDAQIVIDAQADEAAWAQALVVDDWVTYYPVSGQEPAAHAEGRLLVDDQAIYLHCRVFDPEPARVRARITRRDGIWGDDWLGLYLDPSGEAQRAYLFLVNPFGVQADATRMAGGGDEMSWDGLWQSAGQLTDDGYQVELRIPWRTVRHPAELERVGVSLLRAMARTGERASWPARDPDVSGIIVQENLLRGPGAVDERLGLSVTPSLVFGWTDGGPSQERWGALGIAPDLTLRFDPSPAVAGLLTVNPDFSQVEGDAYQIEVNRRYALYLDEKRPFFTEGREWFEGPYGEIVYTRSMNTPRYGARATVEADGWTVAALHVLDGAPTSTVSEGGGWGEAELGPEGDRRSTFDTALRVRHGVGQDGHVGLLYSDKTISGSGLANRVMALDSRVRLADAWSAEGALLSSTTGYESGAWVWAPAGYALLEHESEHWVGQLESAFVDQGFRAENGYLPWADSWFNYGWGGYRFYPGWAPVKRVGLYPFGLAAAWRPSDGALRDFEIEPSLVVHFANAMGLTAWVEREGELVDEVMLISDGGGMELWGPVTRWLSLELGTELGEGRYYEELLVGSIAAVWGELKLTPGRRTSIGFEGVWERMTDGDRELYAGWVGRARLDLFASRRLWARLVLDRSVLGDEQGAQVLMAWELSPGRAVYLGGGLGQQGDDPAGWQVFSKLSWQFIR
jgi:hypothetical protein